MPKQLAAILWDHQVRLEGSLVLERDQLRFQYEKPQKTGLHLVIPKDEIQAVEEYLLFGVERKGIAIHSTHGRTDRFIVDDPSKTRQILSNWLED